MNMPHRGEGQIKARLNEKLVLIPIFHLGSYSQYSGRKWRHVGHLSLHRSACTLSSSVGFASFPPCMWPQEKMAAVLAKLVLITEVKINLLDLTGTSSCVFSQLQGFWEVIKFLESGWGSWKVKEFWAPNHEEGKIRICWNPCLDLCLGHRQ